MAVRRAQPAVAALLEEEGVTYPVPQAEREFHEAATWVFGREGGGRYHDVRGDTGGATKWGISSKAYPTVDIAALTRPEAEALGFAFYWRPMLCPALLQDPADEGLALYLYDTAFNMGEYYAAKTLQRALVAAGRQVAVDGKMGPKTLRALRTQLHVDLRPQNLSRVARGTRWSFTHLLHSERLEHYARGQSQFRSGWFRRANAALLRARSQSVNSGLFW